MIYNDNAGAMLLGCYLNNAQLINNPKYPIDKSDFAPVKFHKAIFVALSKLCLNGVVEVSPIEMENVAKDNTALYNVLIDNDYFDFIETTKALANQDSFEMFYNKTRKLSMLREIKDKGQDISAWYDEEGEKEVGDFSIQDILTALDKDNGDLRNRYDVNYVRSEMKAGEDTESLLSKFEEEPSFGASLSGDYLNTICRGWSRGQLLIRGSMSGGGKTRTSVSDLMSVGALQQYCEEFDDFIDNDNYQGHTLFIHTEMDTATQINPMFLANISGVTYSKIIDGNYTKEERNRILKAGEILKKSDVTLCYMPDFTGARLEQKIGECVRDNDIKYMVFDYIQLNSSLSNEFKESYGTSVRPDMAIAGLAVQLKELSERYNIGILTMSQLNRNYAEKDFMDNGCLAGSSAMVDKSDFTSIVLKAHEKEKSYKRIEPFITKKGFTSDSRESVNICEHVIKARFKSIATDKLKIWSYLDYGLCRRIDRFVTNENDEIVNIPIVKRGG